MTITRREAPSEVGDALAIALGDLATSSSLDALGGGPSSSLTAPIPLYSASRAGFPASPLEELPQFGWRAIALDSQGEKGFADVEQRQEGLVFSRLLKGPQVDAFVEAAHFAEGEESHLEDVELRIIEAPDLRVAAIWLFGQGQESKFIPYQGHVPELMSEGGFRKLLAKRREQVRQAFDEPPPTGTVKRYDEA
jgi:hypothetical protein